MTTSNSNVIWDYIYNKNLEKEKKREEIKKTASPLSKKCFVFAEPEKKIKIG
jgi:uncharacterized membrane protein